MASSKESEESEPFHWHFPELEDIHFEIHGHTLYCIVALFALVLLLSILVIYWRWFWRCQRDIPTTTSHAPTHPPPPPQPRGLDPDAIRALPVTLVTNAAVPETDCSICLIKFEDGDKVKVLPQCQHLYHSECVDLWLSTEPSCPLCRSSIRVDSDLPRIITQ